VVDERSDAVDDGPAPVQGCAEGGGVGDVDGAALDLGRQ